MITRKRGIAALLTVAMILALSDCAEAMSTQR